MNHEKNKANELFEGMKHTLREFKEYFPQSENIKVTSAEGFILDERTTDPESRSMIMNLDETKFEKEAMQRVKNVKSHFRGKVNTNVGTQEINRIKTENTHNFQVRRINNLKSESDKEREEQLVENQSNLGSQISNPNQKRISQSKEPLSRVGTSYMEGLERHQQQMQMDNQVNFDDFLNNDHSDTANFSFHDKNLDTEANHLSKSNSVVSSRQNTKRSNPESHSIQKTNNTIQNVNLRVKTNQQNQADTSQNEQIIIDSKISNIGGNRNLKHVTKSKISNDQTSNLSFQNQKVNRLHKQHPLIQKMNDSLPKLVDNNNLMQDSVNDNQEPFNEKLSKSKINSSIIPRLNIKSRLNKSAVEKNTLIESVDEACSKITETEEDLNQKYDFQGKDQVINSNPTRPSVFQNDNNIFNFNTNLMSDNNNISLDISNIGEVDANKSVEEDINNVSTISGVSNLVNSKIDHNQIENDLTFVKELKNSQLDNTVKSNRIKHGIKSSNSLVNLSVISGITTPKKSIRKHGLHNSGIEGSSMIKSNSQNNLNVNLNTLIKPINKQPTNFKNELKNLEIVKEEVDYNKQDPEICSLCTYRLMDADETKDNNNTIVMTECQHLFHADCWKKQKTQRKYKRGRSKMMCPNCKKAADLC